MSKLKKTDWLIQYMKDATSNRFNNVTKYQYTELYTRGNYYNNNYAFLEH